MVCPWCLVGKRRLDKAAQAAREQLGVELVVRWRPFFLDSTLPPSPGFDKLAHYNAKFGAQRVAAMVPAMKDVGAREGVAFSYGGRISNTLDAHRLAEHAYEVGGSPLQCAVMDAMMRAYFEREADVGDAAVLADAAASAGMDRAEAAAYLASDAGRGEVARQAASGRVGGPRGARVSGVPFFVVNGRYALEGAQEPGVLLEAIRAAVEDMGADGGEQKAARG